MPKIGSFKVMVKPALAMIIGAVVIGFLVPPIARRLSFKKLPSYGYMNPATWRFNSSVGAKAEIAEISGASNTNDTSNLKPILPTRGITWGNSDKGFYINVIRAGANPDSVFLRNVLDYDPTRFPKSTLTLSFEANAPQSFPLIFVIRAGGPGKELPGLLWSKQVNVEGAWKTYTVSVPTEALMKSSNTSNIFAIHMGLQAGKIFFRNIHIR